MLDHRQDDLPIQSQEEGLCIHLYDGERLGLFAL